MATDIASLFGLTPEGLSQQRYQQDLKQGYELAQLSRGDAARATLQSGVGQLGRGIAGLLGVEDPQMQLMTARQQIFNQVDQSNPQSYLEAAKQLQSIGDTQGAFTMADYARKAESEIAQAKQRLAAAQRERLQGTDKDIQIATQMASLTDALDQLKAQPASPERDRAMNLLTTQLTQLERLTTKPEKDLRFGTDRESISAELYDRPFAQLSPAQRAIVNKRVEDEQGKKAASGASKLVLPGEKALADIPAFRASVQKTIAPQIESVTAADQAIQAIDDSIKTNNFVSFNAARVQLAKALGDSQLSRRDVEQAGGDPSLFGKLTDTTSTIFTGTPTLETQNLIKNTLNAIKKVSTNKANREIDIQKNIAYSTPGYDRARVDQALRFPEFEATTGMSVTGDLASQAAKILADRQKAKK